MDGLPSLHALIIGIDAYKGRPLLGAVADAQRVYQYLRKKFAVPDRNITKLFDADATREKIINGFTRMINDRSIVKNDPILIYYAGHGASLKCHESWREHTPSGMVEAILPVDYEVVKDGKPVDAIPDRTTGSMLHRLADAKGDNIVSSVHCLSSPLGLKSHSVPDSDL